MNTQHQVISINHDFNPIKKTNTQVKSLISRHKKHLSIPKSLSKASHSVSSLQNSTPIETNICPMEIAKFFNPGICIEGEEPVQDLESLVYDEGKQRQSEFMPIPAQMDFHQYQKRQTKLMKKLVSLRCDQEGGKLRRMKQSIFDKKKKKDLNSDKNNPDILMSQISSFNQ